MEVIAEEKRGSPRGLVTEERLLARLIQFNFIYIGLNNNNSELKELYIVS